MLINRPSLSLPSLRRALLSLALCLVALAASGQSAYQLIEQHRQWMRDHYPKAEKLSEERLIREAALAITDELKEPEALKLLHAMGREVPSVETYAAMEERGEHDLRFAHTLRALADIYHRAEQRLGRDNPTTGWCKYWWMVCRNNMEDISPLIGTAITEQQAVAQRTTDKENKALCCLFRLLRFDASVRQDLCNAPRLYDDVLQVERQVMSLYPPKGSPACHTKAILYTTLAKARTNFTALHEATAAYSKVGLNPETPYVKNTNTGVVTNAEYLFHVAEVCYDSLFTPGHPEMQEFYVSLEGARLTYGTFSEEHLDVLKALYDYASLYYGDGSLPQLLRKINHWNMLSAMGREIPDAFMWGSMLADLMAYMGEGNLYYVFWARDIVDIVSMQLPLQLADAARLYDESVDHACPEGGMRAAYLRYMLYSDFKDMAPDLFNANVPKLADYYVAHHDTSMASIAFGRQLAMDYFTGLSNHKAGYDYQAITTEDVRKRYGATSQIYFDEKEQELNLLMMLDPETARKQYPTFINEMKSAGADHTQVLSDYGVLENNAANYQHASDLFQQAYDESAKEGYTHRRANMLLNKIASLTFIKDTDKQQQQAFNQVKHILETNTDTLSWLPENFNLATLYLNTKRQYHEAIDMASRGIALCDHLDTGFTPDYIALVTERYMLYAYGLNDMTTTYKLIEQDMKAFDRQAFNYYTTSQLDYLWTVYNITTKNTDDLFTTFSYISRIFNITGSLMNQAEDSTSISKYVVRMFCEIVDLCAYMKSITDKLSPSSMSAEQQKVLGTNLKKMNDFLDGIAGSEAESGISLKEMPSDMDPTVYFAYLSAWEKYYTTLRPDDQKASEIMKRHMALAHNTDPNEYYKACLILFDFHTSRNQLDEALQLYKQHLRPYAKTGNLTANDKTALASRMAALYTSMGDAKNMLPFARTYYQEVKDIMDHNYPLLTEQEQNSMTKSYGDPANWLSATLATYPDRQKISGEVYDAVLYRTGIQLRSQRETRDAIMRSGDKGLMTLVDSLNALRDQLKMSQVNTYSTDAAEIQRQYADVAKQQARINALERTIVDQSAPYRSSTPLDAKWQQVRDRLQKGEAAIEFIYAHPLWMALVVTPGCTAPQAIQLSVADSLSEPMKRLGISQPALMARKLYDERAIDLYRLLWQPLEPALTGVDRIYYATQGLLSTIAFAAISTPDGRYLADRYDLCPLTTTAQLLRSATERRPKTMVAMGNIYYSDRQRQQVQAGDITAARGSDDLTFDDFSDADDTTAGQRASKRYHFKYLPFTRQEVDSLRQVMAGTTMHIDEGSKATEQALRQQLQQAPDVLHLATHGFFIANSAKAMTMPFFKRRTMTTDEAMQRAGVALAGAEDTWTGTATPADDDDGILTANEVAKLNLRGTQLVTLSACETALGDYSFEGMFGLPRGFKQAGAESLLVSLWSVNDKSTARLMTSFYRHWVQGATKRQAFRQAVADVRQAYPQPSYWAPFVLLDATQ